MKNLFLNKKAMTIPELIIVVVLITVVLGAAIMPYIMQQDLLKKQMAISKLQDEVSVALAYIEKDAFRASKANTSTAGTLVLTTKDITGADLDTITYTLDTANENVTRTLNSGTPATIASNITILAFSPVVTTAPFLAGNYIEIDITGVDEGQTVSMDLGVALRAVAA